LAGRPSRARSTSPGSPDAPGSAGSPGASQARRRGRASAKATAERALDEDGTWAGDSDIDDPESVARIICLRLLTAAPRTQAELATALRRRGVPDDAAQAVLARFAEVKLIDDAMFARAWVESRHHSRGLASRALGAELRRRGVPHEAIASALDDLDPAQELATARDLVARRLASTAGQPGSARMRRLVGMLARKGYPAGLAYRVVREALEQEAAAAGRTAYYLAAMQEPDADDDMLEDL
jgi:regulatory protein